MSGITNLKNTIFGTIEIDSTTFEFTIYPNPHKKIPENLDELENIINLFGNRKQGNKLCLDIDTNSVKENIYTHQYLALIYVKNTSIDDSATATLQYWNWCETDTKKQMKNKKIWINDLCRVNNTHTRQTSPVKAILEIISNFCLKYKIHTNYLLVDTDKPATNKLKSIYFDYGYHIDETCKVPGSIVMKKHLSNGGYRRKTRKNTNASFL